jgi:hypothetical protein
MTENLTIRDDGYDETVLILNPNGRYRTVLPVSSFRIGYRVTIYNIGAGAEIIFDPNILYYAIENENHITFIYDGTNWRP